MLRRYIFYGTKTGKPIAEPRTPTVFEQRCQDLKRRKVVRELLAAQGRR